MLVRLQKNWDVKKWNRMKQGITGKDENCSEKDRKIRKEIDGHCDEQGLGLYLLHCNSLLSMEYRNVWWLTFHN